MNKYFKEIKKLWSWETFLEGYSVKHILVYLFLSSFIYFPALHTNYSTAIKNNNIYTD